MSIPKRKLSLRHIINVSIGGRLFYVWMRLSRWIPGNRFYLKVFYRLAMQERLDLNHPKTYTQKLQWLKLHNTDPLYSEMVDKYRAKQIVAEKLGSEYIIPLIGVWNRYDDIDFEKLPAQFVLKTTHDSGTVVVCRDKSSFSPPEHRQRFEKALQTNYFYKSREYPYKNVKPRIIAEQYLHDETQVELTDYKFFCFHGEPKILQITSDKGPAKRVSYFDMAFNLLQLSTDKIPSDPDAKKPARFEEMVDIARRLSRGIIHVRIDLYLINGQIFFGEFTFHHSGGIVPFKPLQWNKTLGDMIELERG